MDQLVKTLFLLLLTFNSWKPQFLLKCGPLVGATHRARGQGDVRPGRGNGFLDGIGLVDQILKVENINLRTT